MLRSLTCIALALTVASAFAVPAESRSRKAVRTYQAPVKDCTRINGRWGYYRQSVVHAGRAAGV